MVDLSTFSDNQDIERFEKSMQSTRTAGVRNLYLSGKGIPKYPIYEELSTASAEFIDSSTNTNSAIYSTYGGVEPTKSFIGEWKSNSSHVLVYFELEED